MVKLGAKWKFFIVTFVLAILILPVGAKEYCVTFDSFSTAEADCPYWDKAQGDEILGYEICFNSSGTGTWIPGLSSHGTGEGMGNCNEEFNFVCIPPSETTESLPALQIEVQVGDQKAKHIPPTQNVRNVTAGQLNAQNLNASYSTYDERAGTTTDARGNKYYKYVEAGMLYGTVKGPISLTVTTRWLSSEESIAIFKSIQVNEIHGYSQKYWLNAGNQFLSNSSYIDAIAAYDEVENMQVKTVPLSHEVIDKKGIALYMLGRYNETIDWYSSARPKSSEAWYSYGMALKAMHLESQAEYAFDQTKK